MFTKQDYYTYLESDHWREFSSRVKKLRKTCGKCGMDHGTSVKRFRQGLNVHHKTYKNLGHEQDADVILLCYRCHMKEHGLEKWADFCASRAIPEVTGFPLQCQNCGIKSPFIVYSMDEIYPWWCKDCR